MEVNTPSYPPGTSRGAEAPPLHRIKLVIGAADGWNIEELRDHGTDPKTRGALLDERIEAIKALWTEDPARVPR